MCPLSEEICAGGRGGTLLLQVQISRRLALYVELVLEPRSFDMWHGYLKQCFYLFLLLFFFFMLIMDNAGKLSALFIQNQSNSGSDFLRHAQAGVSKDNSAISFT